jgi:MFS family permease
VTEHHRDSPDPVHPTPITGAPARPRLGSRARAGAGVRAAGHSTAGAGRAAVAAARRATHSGGAGRTGLSRLIEVHALHNAGDAVVAVALAGSLFFTLPTGEARGQVALFLLLTLLPFSVLAPLVGPFLDRYRHGRRWAIGTTMGLRAVLCVLLALSLDEASWWQFPAALLILIASKAYNVTRSAATPRLLPEEMSLTSANGRMSMAGVVGAAVAVPVAALLSTVGPQWALGLGVLVFLVGGLLAVRLPARVDSTRGEEEVPISEFTDVHQRRRIPREVVIALRANAGLRMLSGFLTIYMAFLLREQPPPGWESSYTVLIGLVAAAAGLGSALGTFLGARTRSVPPMTMVKVALIVDVLFALVTAVNFGMVTLLLLSVVVGTCQQLGKFALDATIQEKVRERRRTSVFGRSETLIQVSWVVGGGLGVLLPIDATVGMGVVAGLLTVWLVLVLNGARGGAAVSDAGPAPRT